MGEIKRLSELDEKKINQSISVFIEGFYNVFSSISKDKEKLHNLFKHSFDYNMTYAYLKDGEVVGFLGLADYQKRPLKFNKEIFMDTIGGFPGKMTYKGMSTALEKVNVASPHVIHIDYIATSPEHRSKGIGKQLIKFVCNNLGYKQIELEVFSKNSRAKRFYEREGFKVVKVKRDLMMIMQGLGNYIMMRLETE